MKFHQFIFIQFLILLLVSCNSIEVIPTPTIIPPTSTPTFTPIPTITLTPTPTNSPTPSLTPIGGGSGTIIYSDWWELYSININGSNKKKLFDNCALNVTFSFDGHYMTCSTGKDEDNRFGGFGVTLFDLKTYRVVKRYAESAFIGLGWWQDIKSWSPDSKKFSFYGNYQNETQNESGLYIIDIDSSSITLAYKTSYEVRQKWSSDGSKILLFEMLDDRKLSGNYYIINSDGTNLVKLNQDPQFNLIGRVNWGKNNSSIFVDGVGINLETLQPNGEINKSDRRSICISPNGKFEFIVYEKSVDNFFKFRNSDNPQEIDVTEKFDISFLIKCYAWSSDSKNIAYYDDKEKSILLFSPETLNISHLIDVNIHKRPSFTGIFLWLPDGKQIIFAQPNGINNGFDVNITDLSGNIKKIFSTNSFVELYIPPNRY